MKRFDFTVANGSLNTLHTKNFVLRVYHKCLEANKQWAKLTKISKVIIMGSQTN